MPQKLARRRAAKRNKAIKRGKSKSSKRIVENTETVFPIFFDFAESNDELILRTELPGVSVARHQLKVEPHRVKILTLERCERDQGDRPAEQWENISQVLDLPIQVDPSVTSASLNCGLLELRMPRPHPDEAEPVLLKAS